MNISLSRHAIDRYRDRVKPMLNDDDAEAELEALAAQGSLVADISWHHAEGKKPDAYLEICDGIALILGQLPCGQWLAVSTVTRSGVSGKVRERRNAFKSRRRAERSKAGSARRERQRNKWDKRLGLPDHHDGDMA